MSLNYAWLSAVNLLPDTDSTEGKWSHKTVKQIVGEIKFR